MFKKAILFLSTALCMSTIAGAQLIAQPCATDARHKEQVRQFPLILSTEAQLEQSIRSAIQQKAEEYLSTVAAKGTSVAWENIVGYTGDTYEFHIPVVVHIIHNYGAEYISDDKVYRMIENMNMYYHKRNPDTVNIIKPFKEYAGNAHITFHLATIDPNGQPTNGITRRYSYLTYGGDDVAKFDQWAPNRYMNIWAEQRIGRPIAGGIVAAYSRFPADGANNPYGDGIISNSLFIGDNGSTISHEAGHFLNLLHVWNSNGSDACLGTSCGDDAVDDTPPTKGHFSGSCPGQGCPLYDTVCATGYVKTYGPVGSSTIIDFPDTVNTQNIMDYSDCTNMFTVGQIARMRATLRSTTTTRINLADPINLIRTGVWADTTGRLVARPDLAPIADFSVNRNFVCAGSAALNVQYTDRSWRDTVTSRSWTFSNGTPAAGTNATQTVTFSQPGWVTTTLTANSNAGTSSITRSDLVYAADPNAISPSGYFQEFNSGGDVDMYPIFNYYGLNSHRWELYNQTNGGFYDNTSIMYHNYDPRPSASVSNQTQSPGGNYSDFYTRAFDLSGAEFTSRANLTFFSAGAYRIANPVYMHDTLLVSYSTDCGNIWRTLGTVVKGDLANNGYLTSQFYPLSQADWKLNSLTIPATAKSSRVYFRFRFISGTDNGEITGFPWGTGNNFFLDRINITGNAVGVNTTELEAKGMTLSPNPTSGNATVTLKGGDNSTAQVNVMDITGKVIYRTEARLANAVTQIEIPAASIAVKGMYMVQVTANGKTQTQKLVVY